TGQVRRPGRHAELLRTGQPVERARQGHGVFAGPAAWASRREVVAPHRRRPGQWLGKPGHSLTVLRRLSAAGGLEPALSQWSRFFSASDFADFYRFRFAGPLDGRGDHLVRATIWKASRPLFA